jgi:hypothetical protein
MEGSNLGIKTPAFYFITLHITNEQAEKYTQYCNYNYTSLIMINRFDDHNGDDDDFINVNPESF